MTDDLPTRILAALSPEGVNASQLTTLAAAVGVPVEESNTALGILLDNDLLAVTEDHRIVRSDLGEAVAAGG